MWKNVITFLFLGLSLCQIQNVNGQGNVCEGNWGSRMFANPANCGSFHVCFDTTLVTDMNCGTGLLFDETLQTCNQASRVDCLATLCPPNASPTQMVNVASVNNCARYFICVGPTSPIPVSCGTGIFVPALNSCGRPEQHTCTIPANVQPEWPTEHFATHCPANVIRMLPHPTNCNWFFFCNSGQMSMIACAEGMSFDASAGTCMPTAQATCFANLPPPTCPPTGISSMANPHSCSSFYLCAEGTPLLQHCAPTLIFDTNLLRCAPQETAVCNALG